MTDKPENPPAFATGNHEHGGQEGMTLRDWFAGQALIAIHAYQGDIGETPSDTAEWCFDLADALLAEREKHNASK